MVQATPALQAMGAEAHTIDINLFPDGPYDDVVDILKIPCIRNVYLRAIDIEEDYDYQLIGPFVQNNIRFRAKKFLTYKTNYKTPTPEAETYYNLVQRIGITTPIPEIRINSGNGRCKYQDMVVLYPGCKTGWSFKKWDKWDLLASHFPIVHVVGKAEDFIAPSWANRKWNWPKHVSFIEGSLQQVANHIANCKFYIGNDGGISHIAAATGVKTIVIFGATNPSKNKPFAKNAKVCAINIPCRPCQWKSDWNELCRTMDCPQHLSCLRDLSIENVLSIT